MSKLSISKKLCLVLLFSFSLKFATENTQSFTSQPDYTISKNYSLVALKLIDCDLRKESRVKKREI